MHFSRLLIASFAISVCIAAQTTPLLGSSPQNSNPPAADQKHTVRVGIAVMTNRSGRQASPIWERDQLVRELQRKRTDRKSSIVIEAVSLDAPPPVIVGNAKPGQILAIDFVILGVSDQRTLAEGTSTASVEENNDTRAADEAMRMTAHRVARELRKDHPPSID